MPGYAAPIPVKPSFLVVDVVFVSICSVTLKIKTIPSQSITAKRVEYYIMSLKVELCFDIHIDNCTDYRTRPHTECEDKGIYKFIASNGGACTENDVAKSIHRTAMGELLVVGNMER